MHTHPVYVCLCECVSICECGCSAVPVEGVESPEYGIPGGGQPSEVSAGNQTQSLCESGVLLISEPSLQSPNNF